MDDWERKLDEAEQHLDEITTEWLDEPLCRRFLSRCVATGDNKIYTAEDVLGERIMRLAALVLGEHKEPNTVVTQKPPGMTSIRHLLIVAGLGMRATPYLWTEEVRAALRAVKIPRHVISPKALPCPNSWHTYETGIQLGGVMNIEGRRLIGNVADAVLIRDMTAGMEVFQFGEMKDAETDESVPVVTGMRLDYGSVYPDDFPDQLRNFATSILTMLAFLNSPYIPKEQRRPSRAARREAERMGRPVDADEQVTFIVLRRPEHRRHKTEDSQEVEWKHRWLVNGHVRAQWYPSEQAHHLIWIAPYLKGPEDAPMLTHAYKVAQ